MALTGIAQVYNLRDINADLVKAPAEIRPALLKVISEVASKQEFLMSNANAQERRRAINTLVHFLQEQAGKQGKPLDAAFVAAQRVHLENGIQAWIGKVNDRHRQHFDSVYHASQPDGIVERLCHAEDAHTAWGSDADARYYLGDNAILPEKISASGTYILPPLGISSGPTAIQDQISRAMAASATVDGPVHLRIPVCHGRQHWRLARITVEQGQVQQADIWDSMSGSAMTDSSTKNLATAVSRAHTEAGKPCYQKAVAVHYAGVQRNGHSCMDYCLQKAQRDAGHNTALTRASTAPAMRRAITATITPRITARTRASATWARSRRRAAASGTYTQPFVRKLNAWVNQRLNEVPLASTPAARAAIEREVDLRLKAVCDRADRGLPAADLLSAAKPLENLSRGHPCTFRATTCAAEAAKHVTRESGTPGMVR